MSEFPTEASVEHALLLATLPNLSKPHFLAPAITAAANLTQSKLIIVLFSRLLNTQSTTFASNTEQESTYGFSQGVSHADRWDEIQKLLTFVYVQATKVAQEMNKILLDVDVLLKGMDEDLPAEFGHEFQVCFRVDGDAIAVPLPQSIAILRQTYLPRGDIALTAESASSSDASPSGGSPLPSQFPVVALGGTFDHLHAGHKILLSMGAWITSEKLIIGVTDDSLLVNKSQKHLLEPLDTRIARVRAFLRLFKPTIAADAVAIKDVYGPTGWDANIQALVVSKETLSGAKSIAAQRESKSLPQLHTFTIDVISSTLASLDAHDVEELKRTKLSSTFIREWIQETQDKKVGGIST